MHASIQSVGRKQKKTKTKTFTTISRHICLCPYKTGAIHDGVSVGQFSVFDFDKQQESERKEPGLFTKTNNSTRNTFHVFTQIPSRLHMNRSIVFEPLTAFALFRSISFWRFFSTIFRKNRKRNWKTNRFSNQFHPNFGHNTNLNKHSKLWVPLSITHPART